MLSAFENKSVVMGKPMPLIVAESLTALVGGDRLAPLKIMGILLRCGSRRLPPACAHMGGVSLRPGVCVGAALGCSRHPCRRRAPTRA